MQKLLLSGSPSVGAKITVLINNNQGLEHVWKAVITFSDTLDRGGD